MCCLKYCSYCVFPYNLYRVGVDVKPCWINQSINHEVWTDGFTIFKLGGILCLQRPCPYANTKCNYTVSQKGSGPLCLCLWQILTDFQFFRCWRRMKMKKRCIWATSLSQLRSPHTLKPCDIERTSHRSQSICISLFHRPIRGAVQNIATILLHLTYST